MNQENTTFKQQRVDEEDSATNLFSVFDDCLNVRPHLLIEIGYNRITDWMVHVYDATGVGIKESVEVFTSQNTNRNAAMIEATRLLHDKFLLK